MRKPKFQSLLKVAMVAALAAVTLMPQLTSIQADGFACGGSTYFVGKWGMGSTCQLAESDCFLRLLGGGYDVCERVLMSNGIACQFGTPSYTNCYWSAGQWKVDCTITHKCEVYQF